MGHPLCVLAAGLLVGQVQDITIVQSDPVQPKCNCGSSAKSGWTQMQTSTQTRTWMETGAWTPASGWTTRNSVNDFVEDRPLLSRISDRLSGLFGSRQETPRQSTTRQSTGWQSTGWESTGWQSTGWHNEDDQVTHQGISVQAAPGQVSIPVTRTQTTEPQVIQRLASPKVSLNEPPLLEVTAEPPVALPAQPPSVKPASFQPPPLQVAPAK